MSDVRATILVCDDDRLVLATLVHGLKSAGYDVVEADNGDDAILLARERRPDLALLDMRMNGKTGLDVAAYLRDHVGTPFMFLSAFNDERIVRQAVEFGALAYLVKPLDVRQIVPAVESALARSGSRGAPTDVVDAPAPEPEAVPTPPVSDAFGAAVDLIERARSANGEHSPEAVAIGILMERHRLSPVAARRMLASMAAGRGRSESALGAEIVAAATLLSGPLSPTA
ncbi:MAG: response regulator [Burkholderiales bacterium]|nr:MAG: response regulator [Burkholderiales bacterium]